MPLGYYEGVCVAVDCGRAGEWMRRNVAPLSVDFHEMRRNLLGGRWYAAMNAGPRCEHVFRELMENCVYFDREYLILKLLELFMLLKNVPRAELNADYCSAEQLRLARHLRDHLLSERGNYVSLAQLAEEHQISVSYLQKLFRQVFTARRFIITSRSTVWSRRRLSWRAAESACWSRSRSTRATTARANFPRRSKSAMARRRRNIARRQGLYQNGIIIAKWNRKERSFVLY